jgi:DNA-binding transcriptional MocR family regulator
MSTRPRPTERKLYEKVADRLSAAIASGTLRPGDRLPSVRKLSSQQRVSVSTVLQAYLQLESLGVIEARPQSGHYVRSKHALPEEPRITACPSTCCRVRVAELVARVYESLRDPKVLQLGSASPATEMQPLARLGRMLARLSREATHDAVSYDFPPGSWELRQQVARRSLEWGCTLSADELVTTCGTAEALTLALRATTKAGDLVAIESPAYYGVLQAIESLGLRAVEIPVHPRDGMQLDALADALKRHAIKAVLVVPNFNNPVGSCMPDELKKELVDMLAKKRIPLIEDDIYGDLHFGAERPRTCKSYDRSGLVLLCGSASKTLAPGFRVGWIAPGRFVDLVASIKFTQTIGTPSLQQIVVAEFLESGGYDHHVRSLRKRLAISMQRMSEAIGEHFPEGTRLSRPQGGCVFWVELPKGISSLAIHERALAERIAIMPGPLFSPTRRYENYVRIGFGHEWSPRIEQSLMTVGRIARAVPSR